MSSPLTHTVYFPDGIAFPLDTRRVCTFCGVKRKISAMLPVSVAPNGFIEWECKDHCGAQS